jgi:hypothetical protein
LQRFREKHRLSKAALVRAINVHPGLELVNWGTLDDWLRGATPKPAYQAALLTALPQIELVLRGNQRAAKRR